MSSIEDDVEDMDISDDDVGVGVDCIDNSTLLVPVECSLVNSEEFVGGSEEEVFCIECGELFNVNDLDWSTAKEVLIEHIQTSDGTNNYTVFADFIECPICGKFSISNGEGRCVSDDEV